MGTHTYIEWTDATWNPTRGCSRVSEGCRNCYAERQAARFSNPDSGGMTDVGYEPNGDQGIFHGFVKDGLWTGRVELIESKLLEPLKWRAPKRIFVNSMSDLFHESLAYEDIDKVFAVMALAPRHTFQILTKRPNRMRDYLTKERSGGSTSIGIVRDMLYRWPRYNPKVRLPGGTDIDAAQSCKWPLPNVWLGVSIEDKESYKKRVVQLATIPAAVRFVSMEPLLSALGDLMLDGIFGGAYQWSIVGGESGPGARQFNLAWAESVVDQCNDAGVACFVKQLGARPVYCSCRMEKCTHPDCVMESLRLVDRKGGDWNEWPTNLRVRAFPEVSK